MPRDQFVVLQGMAIYNLFFLAGTIIDLSLLNLVGALLFMAFIVVMRFRKVIDPVLDFQGLLLLAFMALAVLTTLLNFEDVDPSYLVKLCAGIQFFLIFNSLRLRPLHHAPVRKWFFWLPLGLVACSLAAGKSTEVLGATRAQGLFVNPNNLALIGLCMLFFIDETKDSRPVKLGLHLLTIAIVVLSGTSGALMAYLFGLTTRVARSCAPRQLAVAACLILMLLTLGCHELLKLEPNQAVNPNVVERTVNSLVLVRDYLEPALKGEEINYYVLGKIYGESSTSGLWRLALWSRGLHLLFKAGPSRLLLGHGVGSTGTHMETLMHNDYLRLLFEMGVIGFGLGCTLIWLTIKRLPGDKLYCGAIVLCYGFTENIIDNLVFVTLFLLFLVSARSSGGGLMRLMAMPVRSGAIAPPARDAVEPGHEAPPSDECDTPTEEPPKGRDGKKAVAPEGRRPEPMEPDATPEDREPTAAPKNKNAVSCRTEAKGRGKTQTRKTPKSGTKRKKRK